MRIFLTLQCSSDLALQISSPLKLIQFVTEETDYTARIQNKTFETLILARYQTFCGWKAVAKKKNFIGCLQRSLSSCIPL